MAETPPRYEFVQGLCRTESMAPHYDAHGRCRIEKRHTQKLRERGGVDVHGVLPEGRGLAQKLVQPVDGGALVIEPREQLKEE